MPLKGKKFLELGCGSGLISIAAAKKGARVTASDINPVAVEFLVKNSEENKVEIEVIESDLFNDIPKQPFDIIAINPPYYKKAGNGQGSCMVLRRAGGILFKPV